MWYLRFYLGEAFEAILPFLIRWVSLSLAGMALVGGILLFLFSQVNHGSVMALSTEPVAANIHQKAVQLKSTSQTSLPAASGPTPDASSIQRPVTSQGNTYAAGNCTWYAKARRPDLPNNLGNANTWISRARADGLQTGSEAKAGAIGQRGNHVVYVDQVNADGTINISEMNYTGYAQISHRRLPANTFTYIY